MNLKLATVIAFAICQVYPTRGQQPAANPTQSFVPGGWVRPLYAAAADAWREYFIRAQQATNQLYQQWANMSGNPFSAAVGGLGGLYGIGSTGQAGSGNRPQRPLQGIFNPAGPIQSGLQLSELLPGKQDEKVQDQETRPQAGVQQQQAPIRPQTQVQSQPKPSQIVQPPVQQAPPVQPQTAQAPQPHNQQQNSVPSQIAGVPLQAVGQAAGPIGLFGSSNPLGWMG